MPRQTARSASRSKPRLASIADRHDLYQHAVQAVDAEIDFVDDTYRKLRGRRASLLREDFCGTANTSCEWVRRRRSNVAFGVDLDQPTLDWGRARNLSRLKPGARGRVHLLNSNVLTVRTPAPGHQGVDIVLAMNFSYFIFKERATLRRYFRRVRAGLRAGGLFMLDAYGGADAFREFTERRPIKQGPRDIGSFTYCWEQEKYDPITGHTLCHISFKLRDGSRLRRAFTYDWRLWTLPEITEVLREVGFKRPTVYWEGTDPRTNEGNSVFTPAEHGEADLGWVVYIVAER